MKEENESFMFLMNERKEQTPVYYNDLVLALQ